MILERKLVLVPHSFRMERFVLVDQMNPLLLTLVDLMLRI